MGLLAWIVVGMLAGWLAGAMMKGRGYGIVGDMVLGMVGALMGGFLASTLFGILDPIRAVNVTTLIVAFLGAVIVVALLRALPGRSPV